MVTNALILQSSCEFNLGPGGGPLGESELLVLTVGSIIDIAVGDGRGAGVY
jgi:hypothetical protein